MFWVPLATGHEWRNRQLALKQNKDLVVVGAGNGDWGPEIGQLDFLRTTGRHQLFASRGGHSSPTILGSTFKIGNRLKNLARGCCACTWACRTLWRHVKSHVKENYNALRGESAT